MRLVTWFIRNHLPSSPEATIWVPTPMAVNSATTQTDRRNGKDLFRRDPAVDRCQLPPYSASAQFRRTPRAGSCPQPASTRPSRIRSPASRQGPADEIARVSGCRARQKAREPDSGDRSRLSSPDVPPAHSPPRNASWPATVQRGMRRHRLPAVWLQAAKPTGAMVPAPEAICTCFPPDGRDGRTPRHIAGPANLGLATRSDPPPA